MSTVALSVFQWSRRRKETKKKKTKNKKKNTKNTKNKKKRKKKKKKNNNNNEHSDALFSPSFKRSCPLQFSAKLISFTTTWHYN